MTRLERKNRDDIKYMGRGGFFDAFDDAIKQTWRINDEEYDYINTLPDEYLDALLIDGDIPISKIKISISKVNEAVEMYRNSIQ